MVNDNRRTYTRIDFVCFTQYDGAPVFITTKDFIGVSGVLCLFLPLTLNSAQTSQISLADEANTSTVIAPPSQVPARSSAPESLISLVVTAKDRKGHALDDLMRDEIRLSENEIEQKVEALVPDSSTPFLLAVLIDVSGSRRNCEKEAERTALSNFFRSALRPADAAMIVTFNTGMEVVAYPSSNPQELSQALDKIAPSKSSTALFDAIFVTAGAMIPRKQVRKALLILSDFEDNSSRHSKESAIQEAQRTETQLFCLIDSTMNDLKATKRYEGRNRKLASQMSDQTGGETWEFGSQDVLQLNLKQFSADLHSFYILRYHSTNTARDGTIRNLKLTSIRPGTTLTAAQAYYAPKE